MIAACVYLNAVTGTGTGCAVSVCNGVCTDFLNVGTGTGCAVSVCNGVCTDFLKVRTTVSECNGVCATLAGTRMFAK